MDETARARRTGIALLLGAVIIAAAAGYLFQSMHADMPIVAGPGVTARMMLSDTLPKLKGTNADTSVYVMDSGVPGGTLIILSGTHPQEIASLVATNLIIENVKVTQGKLIIIPQANHSAFTVTEPMEAYVHDIVLPAKDGSSRWFVIGARRTNVADQWPDPDTYVQLPAGERMIGIEARNLNRNHPGLETGTLTTEVSYALTQLVKGASMVIDLHEAYPEYPVINKIVYHERAQAIAGNALFNLEFDGVHFTADPSARNLHGFSHREFGDFTPAQALLSETVNPAIGRFRGRLSMDLVVGGKEPNYVAAAKLGPKGLLFVPFDDKGWPLQGRVGRDLAMIQEIINSFNDLNAKTPIKIQGMPDYDDVTKNGIGKYLSPAPPGSPGPPPFA